MTAQELSNRQTKMAGRRMKLQEIASFSLVEVSVMKTFVFFFYQIKLVFIYLRKPGRTGGIKKKMLLPRSNPPQKHIIRGHE